MHSETILSMDEIVTIPNIKLCDMYYCKMKTKLACKYESKLKCYGMRECRQEIEVLHKAAKKPIRKPTT